MTLKFMLEIGFGSTGGGSSSKGLFDKMETVSQTEATLALQINKKSSIYKVSPTSDFAFSVDLSKINIPQNSSCTFYLLIDMSGGTYNITWADNIQWGNTSPTMTAMVKYLLAFTSFDGGTSWVGNQMYSWE